jgi:DNA-binding MarR family transcriptional regulator
MAWSVRLDDRAPEATSVEIRPGPVSRTGDTGLEPASATGVPCSVRSMVRPLGLPFDPIERAAQTWEHRFGPASAMRAATSVFRVQQILLARFDEALKPHRLTFARYEVLVLLTFSRAGELPLKVIGSRLMVHPTSVTNAIDRLVAAGYVDRRPNPNDGRGVLAGITDLGRAVVESATEALTALEFGLADLPEAERDTVYDLLRRVRLGAGDVAGMDPAGAAIDER